MLKHFYLYFENCECEIYFKYSILKIFGILFTSHKTCWGNDYIFVNLVILEYMQLWVKFQGFIATNSEREKIKLMWSVLDLRSSEKKCWKLQMYNIGTSRFPLYSLKTWLEVKLQYFLQKEFLVEKYTFDEGGGKRRQQMQPNREKKWV